MKWSWFRRRICTQNAKAGKVIVGSEPPIPNFSLIFFCSISRNFSTKFLYDFFLCVQFHRNHKNNIFLIFFTGSNKKKDQNTPSINELLNMPTFIFHQKRSSSRASLFVEPPMSHKKNFQSFHTNGFGITWGHYCWIRPCIDPNCWQILFQGKFF